MPRTSELSTRLWRSREYIARSNRLAFLSRCFPDVTVWFEDHIVLYFVQWLRAYPGLLRRLRAKSPIKGNQYIKAIVKAPGQFPRMIWVPR